MSKKTKPKGHWEVKENCKEAALKYKSRKDFQKGEKGAYDACLRNGWMDEVCSHMKDCRKKVKF